MTPERMAELVAAWVRFYTRGLPTRIADRRINEIDADLHDHIAHERAIGSGDRADLMYGGVLAVGIIGAVIARFRPHGMARALLATAVAQAVVAVIALIAGKHQSPVSSVFEILGLNGFFGALFIGSAWLFRDAARRQPPTTVESHD